MRQHLPHTVEHSLARPIDERRTILIASESDAFVAIVSHLITDCGFTPIRTMDDEPPRLAIARGDPSLVICDVADGKLSVRELVVEVNARQLPLLIAGDSHAAGVADLRVLPDRVAWLEFPISRDAFRATLEHLLTPPLDVERHVLLDTAVVTIEASIRVRTLG